MSAFIRSIDVAPKDEEHSHGVSGGGVGGMGGMMGAGLYTLVGLPSTKVYVQHFKRRIGVQERPFHVVHVPEQSFVPGNAAGRFPEELIGRMWNASMIADDEEYWPFEGEYWADEYSGWR